MKKEFLEYTNSLKKALDSVDIDYISNLYSEIEKRIGSQSSIYLIGNGGSAANASHIAGDFSKTFTMLSLQLKIYSASENMCYVTAASNDIDFSEIYSSLIGTRILAGDLIIYLSGSGNSINLVKCAQNAKKENITQAGIVGYNGGRLKKLVDIPIHVNLNDMEIAEDSQLAIFHFLKQKFCLSFKNEDYLVSTKYDKRIIEDVVS